LIDPTDEAFIAETTQRIKAMNQPQLSGNHINQKQPAKYWGISERTLERWRTLSLGPLFVKIGGRVAYRTQDIQDHEEKHLSHSAQFRIHG
jgi:hypothetical protein